MSNKEGEDEEAGLTTDEYETIQEAFDDYLKGKTYEDNKSAQMVNDILENTMEILNSFKKPYKYIVDCYLSQKVGAGFTNTTSTYYDKPTDNIYHFIYPKGGMTGGKDKSMIFGLLTLFVIAY